MRHKLIAFIFCLFFPCCIFAFPINGYFQQGLILINDSTQDVVITDPASQLLNNYPVATITRI